MKKTSKHKSLHKFHKLHKPYLAIAFAFPIDLSCKDAKAPGSERLGGDCLGLRRQSERDQKEMGKIRRNPVLKKKLSLLKNMTLSTL